MKKKKVNELLSYSQFMFSMIDIIYLVLAEDLLVNNEPYCSKLVKSLKFGMVVLWGILHICPSRTTSYLDGLTLFASLRDAPLPQSMKLIESTNYGSI